MKLKDLLADSLQLTPATKYSEPVSSTVTTPTNSSEVEFKEGLVEKFLEIKNKEKELDEAKNALFDFDDNDEIDGESKVIENIEGEVEQAEDSPVAENILSQVEESLENKNNIREILEQIDKTKDNDTGIEIEVKMKVPESKDKSVEVENENKTDLILKLNEIKQKEEEIASAKTSILTELELNSPLQNNSQSNEEELFTDSPEKDASIRELTDEIEDIKSRGLDLQEVKTTESEMEESTNGTEGNDVEEIRILLKQEKETDPEETTKTDISSTTSPLESGQTDSDLSEDELKKIRIVLDVKEDGNNVTENSSVNTDDDKNTIKTST